MGAASLKMQAQLTTVGAPFITTAAVLPFEYGVSEPGRWRGLRRMPVIGRESEAAGE